MPMDLACFISIESVAATSLEAEPMDENDNTDPPNNVSLTALVIIEQNS